MRGVHEDARIGRLAHHRGERGVRHPAKAFHIVRRQGRRLLQTHRGQLRGVSHQDELAVHAGAHESHQIGQKIAAAEGSPAFPGGNAYKRHLIYYEERAFGLVGR